MRMLPGTRALRTFEAAARLLNFTRAADELGLTPAAVSYQIKEIEDQLGLALFARSSRNVQLTPAGSVLLDGAREALGSLQRAVGQARRAARGDSQLRISLGARFATSWLMPRLGEFRAAHPDWELSFDVSDELRDFDADDIDVAIRFGRGRYAGARAERLFETEIVAVCSPALLKAQEFAAPGDLLSHTLCHVDCTTDGITWPNWPMWMAAAGVEGFDASLCVGFADSSHVVQAVLEGGAVGLVELPMIARDLAEGRLVRLFDVGISPAPGFAYHLVYPDGGAPDRRVQAFRDWILRESAGSRQA